MPIWIWLIIGFFVISTIGVILNFAKLGIVIAIAIILWPTIRAYDLTDAKNYLDKIPTEKIQIIETNDVEIFKINPIFPSGRTGFNIKIEDLRNGPESIEILYNPERISEIPSQVRSYIEVEN